jgi:ribosomal protein S18 acetylase RimI-like enzyme
MAISSDTKNNVLFYKDFSCRKPLMIKQFTLPKSGATATIETLAPRHLPQVLALHDATRAALPDDQKMFVLPQPTGYFEKFLDGKNGIMLGVSTNGQLVAQLVIMGPLALEDVVTKRAVTRNSIPFHHVGVFDTVVAIKSMAVHPDFRGNELSQHILAAALEEPLLQKADHAFAQISSNNQRSWELFLRNGFGIVAAAIDPEDQKGRFILQRPIEGFSFDMAPSADDVDAVKDFPAIMQLTQREALIGRLDEFPAIGGGLRLAFSADAELQGPLPRVAQSSN